MQWIKKIFSAFTKSERIAFLVAGIIAIISLVTVLSVLVAKLTTTVPTAGGEYSEGAIGQPEYINPVTASDETDLDLVKMVYSNIDDVADSIDESPDGRTWTVHLKQGLTWQDGEQLTSDDIIFTVQSIQDPTANSPLYQSWQGVAVSRISELEVQFNLSEPYAFFGDNLKNIYIVPKHLFANTPPANWNLSDYNLKPIGSGPYKFVSYDKQSDGFISSYHLEAWNGYAGQQPLIQNFNFQYFDNTPDLIKAFNSGSIDGMGNLESTNLSDIDRPYDLFSWNTPSYYAVFFNQSKSLPLEDTSVREALSTAVDRDSLVNTALGGDGTPDYGPIPQGAPYYIPTGVSTSLTLASTTLTDAGWIAGTSTAFRSKTMQGTNVPLVVNLTVPDIDFLVKTAETLQDTWQSIGVQVNIATDTTADITSESITNRDYESLLFGNILGPSSDLYSFWDSSQRFSPGLNLAIYSNPKVDSLIESARQNTDDASRAQQIAQAEADIVNDNPAIFLYSPDYLYVSNKNVQGITTGFLADPSDRFLEMSSWYLNTARVLK